MPSADAILNLLARHSLALAGLALIAVPLACASKRASVHWRYWIAVVLLVKCLAFPVFDLSWISPKLASSNPFEFTAPIPAFAVSAEAVDHDASSTVERPADRRGAPSASDPSRTGLAFIRQSKFWIGIWLAGALSYAGWLTLHAVKVRRFLKNNRSEPDLEIELEFAQLLQGAALGYRPRLQMIEGIRQPFVWGAWAGSIYLPQTFGNIGNRRHRKLILAHELGHVIRRDASVNLIQMAAQAVFWFHPAVWWLNAFIRQEREKCCDEFAVSAAGASVKDYAAAVVDHLVQAGAPGGAWTSLAVSGNARSLESRILSLLDPKRRIAASAMWPGATIAGLSALLILPIQVGWSTPADPAWNAPSFELIPFASSIEGGGNSTHRLNESLPLGRIHFESVPFEFHGAVRPSRSSNPDAESAGRIFNPNRPFQRLHLVHGVEGSAGDAEAIAEILLRYRDGHSVRFPIRYREHVLSFEFWDYEPVRDPASKMAWVGGDAESRINHSALRLFYTPWRNPHPDRVVESVTYLATQSGCDPFLAAMTLE